MTMAQDQLLYFKCSARSLIRNTPHPLMLPSSSNGSQLRKGDYWVLLMLHRHMRRLARKLGEFYIWIVSIAAIIKQIMRVANSYLLVTAYVKNGTEPIIAFFDTNVDKNLTVFGTKLVEKYTPLKWNTTNCGTTCGSDHMSFTRAGYPAIFVAESLYESVYSYRSRYLKVPEFLIAISDRFSARGYPHHWG